MRPSPSAFDLDMMDIALRMARRGLGRTAPNPAVGAVIADEATGEIVARGWTQPGGRPHAETEAIVRAGHRARGRTMYVTLEPCSHHGRTPPCCEAVVAAGLARVVVAITDPDPRVAGRGLQHLRAAGIAVMRGVRAEAAHWLTRGHIVRVTERRPFVQLKVALGPDGEVPRGSGGAPVFVTGPEARALGHLLRAEADAILVGHVTLRDDDPDLTCRLPGLAGRSPDRVVLATRLEGVGRSKLAATARAVSVHVMTGEANPADAPTVERLRQLGITVHHLRTVDGRIWLPSLLETLAAAGTTRLLVEGGPSVWRAFARHGLYDEVVLFHARVGGAMALEPSVAAARLAAVCGIEGLALADHRYLPTDDMFVWRQRAGAILAHAATGGPDTTREAKERS